MLNHLGHIASLRGALPRARRHFRDSLLASRAGGDRRRLGFTLAAISALMADQGEAARAVRLNAASQADLDALGAQLAPPMRALYDRQLAPAQAALGADAVEAAEADGRRISLERAVEETLAWLGDAGDQLAGETWSVAADHPGRSSLPSVQNARSGPDENAHRARLAPPPTPHLAPLPEPTPTVRTAAHFPLTRREREVAALIARGCTNRQIAEALVIAEGTAENHVLRVMRRLGLQNRAQVAAWAVERRLHENQATR